MLGAKRTQKPLQGKKLGKVGKDKLHMTPTSSEKRKIIMINYFN